VPLIGWLRQRLLRRLDSYTIEAFNAPATLQRAAGRGGRHAAR
jgi:hypothetical protein